LILIPSIDCSLWTLFRISRPLQKAEGRRSLLIYAVDMVFLSGAFRSRATHVFFQHFCFPLDGLLVGIIRSKSDWTVQCFHPILPPPSFFPVPPSLSYLFRPMEALPGSPLVQMSLFWAISRELFPQSRFWDIGRYEAISIPFFHRFSVPPPCPINKLDFAPNAKFFSLLTDRLALSSSFLLRSLLYLLFPLFF